MPGAREGSVFLFRQKNYEIQASRKGRWTIEQTATDQASDAAAADDADAEGHS